MPESTTLEYFRCLYARAQGGLGDFIHLFHRDIGREIRLKWRRDCLSFRSGGAKDLLRGRGAPGFSNSSKTKAKPNIYQTIMTGLTCSQRGVSIGGFTG